MFSLFKIFSGVGKSQNSTYDTHLRVFTGKKGVELAFEKKLKAMKPRPIPRVGRFWALYTEQLKSTH
jgi:hypothetical protein